MHRLRVDPGEMFRRWARRNSLRSTARLCDLIVATRREKTWLYRYSFTRQGIEAGLHAAASYARLVRQTDLYRQRRTARSKSRFAAGARMKRGGSLRIR